MATRRKVLAIILVLAIASSAAVVLYYSFAGQSQAACTPGPGVGNESKSQAFLIVASVTGFNDSANHGVPVDCWPVIRVPKGTLVNITVTNVDKQSHGFDIANYYDSGIVTIAPGQTIKVSFVASETGSFQIYCSIFCTVHWAMQSGELIVT